MNTSNTPSTGGIGLPEAADQFAAILGGEKPTTQFPRGQAVMRGVDEQEEAPAEETTQNAAPPAEETPAEEATEEVAPAEPAEEKEAAAAPEEGQEEPAAEPNSLVTVKVDGKEQKVPLDEVIAGYSRTADYTRKTQELASSRKAVEAEFEAARVERAQYAQMLSALQQQLTQLMPQEPDWNALYNSDPLEYVRQRDVWRERNDKLVAAQAEQQRLHALQTEEQRAQIQNMVVEGRKQLLEKRPEWKKPETWEADRAKLLSYGQSAGYSEDELMQATDPRAILILDKARRYDELTSRKPQPAPARSPAPAKAGSGNTVPRSTSETTKAKQRLAKTGRVADAAALFERIID